MAKQYKKNGSVFVFHDGKICRGREGIVLDIRAQGLLIEFDAGETYPEKRWFRRCDKSGKYNAIGWNFSVLNLSDETLNEYGYK